MKHTVSFLLLAAFLSVPNTSGAAVIFDNGGTPFDVFNLSDANSFEILADDFSLLSGSSEITDIHWSGSYGPISFPVPVTDNFTVEIYGEGSGGQLAAAPLFTLNTSNVGRSSLGVISQFNVFSYSVAFAPITLTPNTRYWLSIYDDTGNWLWAGHTGSTFDNGVLARPSTSSSWAPRILGNVRFDFELTNDAVSTVAEPATLALLGIGIAGVTFARRRHLR